MKLRERNEKGTKLRCFSYNLDLIDTVFVAVSARVKVGLDPTPFLESKSQSGSGWNRTNQNELESVGKLEWKVTFRLI